MKSVYFFTFHKCASSLFGHLVLPAAIGLHHIDYEKKMYDGISLDGNQNCLFQPNNFIYGPLKLTNVRSNPIFSKVTTPGIRNCLSNKSKAVFLIRDPRDILISQYYSFGHSHGLSQNSIIRERQLKKREEISKLGLDNFVINNISSIVRAFKRLDFVYSKCHTPLLLKYEELIERPQKFVDSLSKEIKLHKQVKQDLVAQSRPTSREDIFSHKRLGKCRQYETKLSYSTQKVLKEKFKVPLEKYHFEKF